MHALIGPINRQVREFREQNPGHPNPEAGAFLDVLFQALKRVEERLPVLDNRVKLLENFHVRLLGQILVGLGSVAVFVLKKNAVGSVGRSAGLIPPQKEPSCSVL